MKINPSITPPTAGASSASPATERANGGAKSVAGGDHDSVKISDLSTQLHALETGAAKGDFDQAKVDSIKQAIADGTLTVNAEVVADRLLADARGLLVRNN